MTVYSWRKSHGTIPLFYTKGQARDEIKVLWTQYKEGQYEIETENNEAPVETETTEVEEVEEVEEIDHRKEFLKLFNELYILNTTGEISKPLHQQLMNHALETRPKIISVAQAMAGLFIWVRLTKHYLLTKLARLHSQSLESISTVSIKVRH